MTPRSGFVMSQARSGRGRAAGMKALGGAGGDDVTEGWRVTSRRACHPGGGAGQEEEALLSEMDVTGQAFEDMQEQNLRLLQQLREKDDANFKLMSERIKANQIHKLLREEKDELAEQVLALKAQVGPKCPGKTQGFGEVQGDVGVQENQDGWRNPVGQEKDEMVEEVLTIEVVAAPRRLGRTRASGLGVTLVSRPIGTWVSKTGGTQTSLTRRGGVVPRWTPNCWWCRSWRRRSGGCRAVWRRWRRSWPFAPRPWSSTRERWEVGEEGGHPPKGGTQLSGGGVGVTQVLGGGDTQVSGRRKLGPGDPERPWRRGGGTLASMRWDFGGVGETRRGHPPPPPPPDFGSEEGGDADVRGCAGGGGGAAGGGPAGAGGARPGSATGAAGLRRREPGGQG